jgi:hypothetical protein
MATYLVFFGNSQGFLNYFYDSSKLIPDFDSIIKDFNLLESRVFTVDSVDNKEILSRYSFVTSQGKQYSLLKLYSFAQAYNIPRIEGCIFGVGIVSDSLVSLSSKNLNLLKVAKDNFSKLSLNGLKFNKSDFLEDATKIWRAIVKNEGGNLIESIELEASQFKNQEKPVAFNVDNLYQEPVVLRPQSTNFDKVYFSEDLAHLKRAQQKSGADHFSIYVKNNGNYILYKETVEQPLVKKSEEDGTPPFNPAPSFGENPLDAVQKEHQITQIELRETKKQLTQKSKIIIFAIFFMLLLSVLAFFWIYCLQKKIKNQSQKLQELNETIILAEGPAGSNGVSFLKTLHTNSGYYDTLALFAKDLKYIVDFNPKKSSKDSSILNGRFQNLNRRRLFLGIEGLEEYGRKYENSIQYIRDSNPPAKINSPKKNPQ